MAASGFASKKLNAARSARAHRTLVVDGVPDRGGPIHFEMTPTTEREAATTSGESRHKGESTQGCSIVFVFERRKGARSAKEDEVRVPVGVQAHLGQDISVTTLITGVAAVSTLGRSSHDALPGRERSRCAACASRKQKEALSVREIAKAAADGVHQELRILPGPYHSVMTPIIAGEVVPIVGISIVLPAGEPSIVKGTVPANESTRLQNAVG